MLNDEICRKRDELNKSIENGEEYSKIYKLSVELDDLIAKYYINEYKDKLIKAEYNKKDKIETT